MNTHNEGAKNVPRGGAWLQSCIKSRQKYIETSMFSAF